MYSRANILLGIPLVMGLIMTSAPAYADWGHRSTRGHDHGYHNRHYSHYPYGYVVHRLPQTYISLSLGNVSFFYSEGRFYRRHSRDYVTVAAPIGAVVYTIPTGCERVRVRGEYIYTYEGVYYRPFSGGYRVVEAPEVYDDAPLAAAAPVSTKPQDSFTVNIRNANGGYTAVVLKKSGSGYVGPQGEYYPDFPQVEQLRAMYAR